MTVLRALCWELVFIIRLWFLPGSAVVNTQEYLRELHNTDCFIYRVYRGYSLENDAILQYLKVSQSPASLVFPNTITRSLRNIAYPTYIIRIRPKLTSLQKLSCILQVETFLADQDLAQSPGTCSLWCVTKFPEILTLPLAL